MVLRTKCRWEGLCEVTSLLLMQSKYPKPLTTSFGSKKTQHQQHKVEKETGRTWYHLPNFWFSRLCVQHRAHSPAFQKEAGLPAQ